jgi:hypothetical protein
MDCYVPDPSNARTVAVDHTVLMDSTQQVGTAVNRSRTKGAREREKEEGGEGGTLAVIIAVQVAR